MNLNVILSAITFLLLAFNTEEKVKLHGEFKDFPIEILDGEEVILKFNIQNVSEADLPEDSFRYELWVNGEMKSLDNITPAIPSGHIMTYTKENNQFHFKAKKGVEYIIQAKIIPKKLGVKYGLESQVIEKRIKVS